MTVGGIVKSGLGKDVRGTENIGISHDAHRHPEHRSCQSHNVNKGKSFL
jgi:hypothetical protein